MSIQDDLEIEKKEDETSSAAPAEDKQQEEDQKDEKVEKKTTDAPASGDKTKQEESVDYKAELERATKQLSQAEHTIETLKKDKKKPVEAEEDDEDEEEKVHADPENQDDLDSKVEAKVNERMSKFQRDMVQDNIDATLENLTDDPDERKLILFHYDNTIQKSGYSRSKILSDLENAQALANRARIVKENSEFKRALKAKQTISNNGGGSNQDRDNDSGSGAETKYSKDDLELMKKMGISPEDVEKNRPKAE